MTGLGRSKKNERRILQQGELTKNLILSTWRSSTLETRSDQLEKK
jgi:hypothetical protein